MTPRLTAGKTALVTGSTRGLGRAIATLLAEAGADVMLHDVDAAQAGRFGEAAGPEEVVDSLRALGVRAAVCFGDLTDSHAAREVGRSVLEEFGRLDVLVNCAGGDIGASGGKPVPNDCLGIPEEDLRVELDRNLVSTMHVCRALCPAMAARGEGSVINIASQAGIVPVSNGCIYAVAKAAVIHWTRCLAAELRPSGVRVNSLCPGEIKSARFLVTRHLDPERLADRGRLTRLGEPLDVARVCLFLASDLSEYVTGQNIEIAGMGH